MLHILWLVTRKETKHHVVCSAMNREYAKSKSHQILLGNPDDYVVTPLTEEGDRVHLDISINLDINFR